MASVTCCSLSQLKNIQKASDINLLIVRNPKNDIAGVTLFQYLAPSEELYSFAMKNRDRAGWWDIYKQVFEKELESNEKQIGLQMISSYVKQGFNVNLICYCGSCEQCHRSLVAAKLKRMGIEVKLL